jgi:predicted dehydrogenase
MKYSRRKFITTLGAGTALLTMPALPIFSYSLSRRSNEKKLGIALVGLGNYATYQLAPALQLTNNCYLAGVVTGTPSKGEKWKKLYSIDDKNIYNYDNFDSIAENESIDIVYIVLPNSMHHEFTIRAAKAGKHVICEKPMALNVNECREMIDVCKKENVRLFIGYRLHSEPYNRAAMKFRATGVGKLKIIEAGFGFKIGDPTQWRLKKTLSGGGALMDLGIYCIQAARYSTGEEPIYITAQEYKTDPVKFSEVDETITWQMEFPTGAVSNSITSYAGPANRLYLGAEQGWFELRPAFNYRGIKGKTNDSELVLPDINQQAAQMENFTSCILENKPSDAGGEEGLKDLRVIEAIYKSIQTKEKVKVE